MPVIMCPYCRAATATAPCQACGAELPPLRRPRRFNPNTWLAIGLVGILVGVVAGGGRAFLLSGTGPQPVGLHLAALTAAIAALWFIGRAFGARR
jgi:hypothetical protein